jgi:hypothetical protein
MHKPLQTLVANVWSRRDEWEMGGEKRSCPGAEHLRGYPRFAGVIAMWKTRGLAKTLNSAAQLLDGGTATRPMGLRDPSHRAPWRKLEEMVWR